MDSSLAPGSTAQLYYGTTYLKTARPHVELLTRQERQSGKGSKQWGFDCENIRSLYLRHLLRFATCKEADSSSELWLAGRLVGWLRKGKRGALANANFEYSRESMSSSSCFPSCCRGAVVPSGAACALPHGSWIFSTSRLCACFIFSGPTLGGFNLCQINMLHDRVFPRYSTHAPSSAVAFAAAPGVAGLYSILRSKY